MANDNGFVDTTPQAGNGDQYRDPTHIPSDNEFSQDIKSGVVDSNSRTLAKWLREKQWGTDTREALALFVEWLSTKWHSNKELIDSNSSRQSQVEKRQTDLEGRFTGLLSGATKDSEVIDARNSQTYGQFDVLDKRFENIETLLSKYVPQGFEVTIKHNLNRMPAVSVFSYEWAIGTAPDGFGTEPDGLFGGTNPVSVASNVVYSDANTIKVVLPLDYKLSGELEQHDNSWYLIDGIKTLKFTLDSSNQGIHVPNANLEKLGKVGE
ncbi:hypothetical protein R55214_HHFBAMCI_01546 [Fructobacillus evanidus]|uniref:Baseplate upper protein immunoglobulin like domain-containing protein n=1 Tax=Fructobacillus evanidus TaxID=3064281 RepID=A0ABM9N208_9LACO|nr:hypothetical protein R55250_KEHBDPNM_00415 [Fructobacillus sp. LMG 32999]CAK1248453.1 hypothetical protein R53534_HOPDCFKK_01171 [Fructobacillus sp. LMG 32999]CAK1249264.1 hypothetical protein R53718_MFFEMHAI_01577 [Fructobacillus sp. LMG 32999]CAK1254378.1 hypothetical protein R55214_HHFBAMCI_01546 [Fructobacillus sp. LMG 32999]CAK1255169.1 hypothetical protein R55234_GCHJJDIB_01595 [Fructobacillus sp. LMG 32999]